LISRIETVCKLQLACRLERRLGRDQIVFTLILHAVARVINERHRRAVSIDRELIEQRQHVALRGDVEMHLATHKAIAKAL
jgi:hypothetical protein